MNKLKQEFFLKKSLKNNSFNIGFIALSCLAYLIFYYYRMVYYWPAQPDRGSWLSLDGAMETAGLYLVLFFTPIIIGLFEIVRVHIKQKYDKHDEARYDRFITKYQKEFDKFIENKKLESDWDSE